jgi:hypothetical protein
MTTSPPAPENPTHGLTAIFGDHDVVLTGEEHHQQALQPYAPWSDGRARQVAVELVPARSPVGPTPGSRASRSGWTVGASGS